MSLLPQFPPRVAAAARIVRRFTSTSQGLPLIRLPGFVGGHALHQCLSFLVAGSAATG